MSFACSPIQNRLCIISKNESNISNIEKIFLIGILETHNTQAIKKYYDFISTKNKAQYLTYRMPRSNDLLINDDEV